MRVFDASEAAVNFDFLLNTVEHGESVVISRDGKEVALFSPASGSSLEAHQAFEIIRELRASTKPLSIKEILAARDEGRR